MRRVALWCPAVVVAATLAVPASALAVEQITAVPTVTGKAGAAGTLSVKATVTNSLGGFPAPLSQLVIDLPPRVTYNFDTTPVCPLITVTGDHGDIPPACPVGSQIGSGSSLLEADLGAADPDFHETAQLAVFLLRRSPVRFEVWGNGVTPVFETVTFGGTLTAAAKPFAEKVTVDVPPIPAYPNGPDASIATLTFKVGGTHTVTTTRTVQRGGRKVKEPVKTQVGLFDLPDPCTGFLPYAASASFLDSTTASITGKVACP